jgi:hypothetical protein
MIRLKVIMLLFAFACSPCAHGANNKAQPMSLTVFPVSVDHKMPLSQALGQIGIRVRDGYVLFGIDVRTSPEPQVYLKITDPEPLGAALAQIVGQVSGYGYQAVSDHVVEVYSLSESRDPADILNIHVADFEVKNEPAMNIFSRPKRFIPELKAYLLKGKTVQPCGSIGPGLSSGGSGVTLSLHNMTLREILDSVAEADATRGSNATEQALPVGWVHKVQTNRENETVDTWSFLSTVPHGWERYLPKEATSLK